MKICKYIFIMFFLTSVAYSQNVKITDYQVPISKARRLILSGFHNWSQTGDSVTTNEFRLDGDYSQFYSSLPFAWNLDVNAFTSRKYEDTTRVGYNLTADIRKYFSNTKGFFGFAAVTSTYLKQKEFGSENRPELDLLGGVGYGRYLDATPMFKAIRIDQELRKGGITTAYMPKATMMKIADIIDKESEYRDKYKDIYEGKIIEDIGKEIVASGVSRTDNLTAFGFFRIRQVLTGTNQFVTQRLYGGDIRAGIGYRVLTRNQNLKSGSATLNLQGRYSYPLDLRQQVNFTGSANTPMDSSFFKLIEGTGQADYTYTLTNKIQFFALYVVTFSRLTQIRDISVADQRAAAGFRFYLENYISLAITGGYEKPHNDRKRLSSNISLLYTIW